MNDADLATAHLADEIYGDVAADYLDKGWSPLPLPPRAKSSPPAGYTGTTAPMATEEDVVRWMMSSPDGNIGVRPPETVIGLDVDSYGPKHGDETLAAAEKLWGSLTPTFFSSARGGPDSDRPSGIYWYRVSEGVQAQLPGKIEIDGRSDIEIVRHGHRYGLAWPSVHPDGMTYTWYRKDGTPVTDADGIPSTRDLSALPQPWVNGLLSQSSGAHKGSQPAEEVMSYLPEGEPCARVSESLSAALDCMTDRCPAHEGENSHDAMNSHVLGLARLASHGHVGFREAATELRAAFSEHESGEFERSLAGALEIIGDDLDTGHDPCGDTTETPGDLMTSLRGSEDSDLESMIQNRLIQLRAEDAARAMLADEKSRKVPMPSPMTVEEVMVAEDDEDRIAGFVAGKGIATVTAQAKTGKTHLIINMVWSLATGEPFLGKFTTKRVRGRIAIVDFELTPGKRKKWLREAGFEAFSDSVRVFGQKGKAVEWDVTIDQRVDALAKMLRELDIEVLIIDPLAPLLRAKGIDENSSHDMGPILDGFEKLKERAGISELIISTHAGHKADGRSRGTSDLLGWPDSMITITRDKDDTRLISTEGRDIELEQQILTLDGRKLTVGGSKRLAKAKADQEVVMDYVMDFPGSTRTQITAAVGVGNDKCGAVLQQLVTMNMLRREKGKGNTHLYFPADE